MILKAEHKKRYFSRKQICKKIGKNLTANQTNVKIIEAGGNIITTGLIDMHMHLREPDFEEKETIQTGTKAAAFEGFTSVICMVNTRPTVDNAKN